MPPEERIRCQVCGREFAEGEECYLLKRAKIIKDGAGWPLTFLVIGEQVFCPQKCGGQEVVRL